RGVAGLDGGGAVGVVPRRPVVGGDRVTRAGAHQRQRTATAAAADEGPLGDAGQVHRVVPDGEVAAGVGVRTARVRHVRGLVDDGGALAAVGGRRLLDGRARDVAVGRRVTGVDVRRAVGGVRRLAVV